MTQSLHPVIIHADLAADLAAVGALDKKTARAVIDDLFVAMAGHLNAGAIVHLRGFGRFEVVAVAARPGRNPKTGEPTVIPAQRRVKFRPSKQLLKEAS